MNRLLKQSLAAALTSTWLVSDPAVYCRTFRTVCSCEVLAGQEADPEVEQSGLSDPKHLEEMEGENERHHFSFFYHFYFFLDTGRNFTV